MFLENIDGKWKSVSVKAKCDEVDCGVEYKARISTALKQEKEIGHHQCKKCSSRRAGRKTAQKMAKEYSRLYSGDGNPAKRPGVGDKISKTKKGVKLTEDHKASLRKPKKKSEKFLLAMQDSNLRAERSNRMKLKNPVRNPEVREKISNSITNHFLEGGNRVFYSRMKTGWVSNEKTKNPIWCRSGLEKRFLAQIEQHNWISCVESAEGLRIKYLFEGIIHNYLPDFKLTFDNDLFIIVEIKSSYFATLPKWDFKLKALHEFCEYLNIEYSVLSEKEEHKWSEILLEKKHLMERKRGI